MIRIIKLGLVSVLRFDCVVAPAVNHTSIEGIPHVDLAVCPDNKPDEDTGFCRLAFDGMKATVFAFHYKGDDACLAGVKQYSVKQFLTK